MKDKELGKTSMKQLGPEPDQFGPAEKKVGKKPMREAPTESGGRQGHPAKPSQPLSIRYIED